MRGPHFDPAALAADVHHLGNADLGIYIRLLARVVTSGSVPSDIDRLRLLTRARSPEDHRSLEAVIAEFFEPGALPDGTRVLRPRGGVGRSWLAGGAH